MNDLAKKLFLSGVGVAAAGALYAYHIERAWVQLEHFTLNIAKPGLPPNGLTVLHLSDFHFRGGGAAQRRKAARLCALLQDVQYDVLALTGDLIHDAAGFPAVLSLIEGLRPRSAAFICPGNHDYAEYSVWGVFDHTWRQSGSSRWRGLADAGLAAGKLFDFTRKVLRNELVRLPVAFNDVPGMLAELSARGVTPLVNRAAPLNVAGTPVWFAGVDDALEGQPDLAAALAAVPTAAPLVLLAHNPDVWLDARTQQADLVLSGHTHGGQIRLPMIGAAHTQGTHLTRRQPAGWFHRGASHMFVSRGLGESIPLRFGVRPQAALIRLLPAD